MRGGGWHHRTSPPSGTTSPAAILINVVFPAPLEPTRPTASPDARSSQARSSTLRAPKLFVTAASSSRVFMTAPVGRDRDSPRDARQAAEPRAPPLPRRRLA